MNFIDTVKAFFKSPKVDSRRSRVLDAFSAASAAYDATFHAIDAYTNRANHRYAILGAARALHKAPLDDPYAANAYDEAVTAYTDPADFDPYTEAYLDAHPPPSIPSPLPSITSPLPSPPSTPVTTSTLRLLHFTK